MKEKALIYALHNAVKYSGKANPGAIIGRLFSDFPEMKSKAKEVSKIAQEAVKEANSLSQEEQLSKLKKLAPELLEEKKEVKKKELKELDEAKKGKVTMRFAPSPSGPMHIGHAITGGLTSLYIDKYKGKFILRIEDTNPDNIYPPAYELLPKDANWIFGNVTETWIQSDRLKIYYKYAEKLIDLDAAYVCSCSQDEFKKSSLDKKECPCRGYSTAENKKRWKKMFDEFKEGEAIVRFKSDMQHKNPAMRDFPLVRINESEHPKQDKKYKVWPLMNLCVTVDDIEAGMTHIIRAKEHMDNAKRQELMFNVLGKKFPKTYFLGRIKFIGLEISCSKTKARIEKGEFEGWDDIRLPFLGALKRRGYQPESFLKFTEEIGLSEVDKRIKGEEFFKTLNAHNKEIIDPTSNRYFFVKDPVQIKIEGAPKLKVELDLHPDTRKGGRKFETNGEFYVSKEDYGRIEEGKLVRLMDCLNFIKEKGELKFHSKDYEEFRGKGKLIIHWLPVSSKNIDMEVLMPDNVIVKGLGEVSADGLKEGEVVQLERFGFARLDDKNKMVFWYGHD